MSMYDMEGLQDQIIKASSAAVEFNETTGDFKICRRDERFRK
jgi:hypothetical protein